MSERIAIDPNICHGKPVIRGTRTPVMVILNALGNMLFYALAVLGEYAVAFGLALLFSSDPKPTQVGPASNSIRSRCLEKFLQTVFFVF